MGAQDAALTDSALVSEIENLRVSVFRTFLVVLPTAGLTWLMYAVWREWDLGSHMLAAFALVFGSLGAERLHHWHVRAAMCLLLLSAIVATEVLVEAQPQGTVLAFGALTVIIANGLLGGVGGGLTAVVMWSAVTWELRLVTQPEAIYAPDFDTLAFYLCVAGATWLAARPLRESANLALVRWGRARDALQEVRERRGELYRTLRALEEATYRIERINNELLIAKRDAEEARIIKTRFVTTVSHELRSPLNLVLGFSRLMALSPDAYPEPLPQAYRDDAYTIYRNCQHLLALVDDVLDLSQIEAQRLPLIRDSLDLEGDVVRHVADLVRPLAARKGLWLRLELSGNVPIVMADPVRLRQALLNLLTNAIRLTDRGGVTIRTYSDSASTVIAVQDTGPGISEQELPHLFREFTQLRSAEGQADQGSGLGLAISKHLVELHGGHIWVESRKGVGTTFSFSIPIPDSQPESRHLMSSGEPGRHIVTQSSCIIVHPDPSAVRILARQITGYQMLGLADAGELPLHLNRLRPLGIITSPNHAEAVAQNLSPDMDVPVITCAVPNSGAWMNAGNIVGYLTKPIAVESLMDLMTKVRHSAEATVLLVDDEPEAVRMLEKLLMTGADSYQILKAYDGTEALNMMEEQTPDVVLLDMVMPILSGQQVLDRMQADERLGQVPVIIVSGKDWVDTETTLGRYLKIEFREPMSVARGIRCMQSLLDAVSSGSLSTTQAPQQSAKEPPG